MVGSASIKKNPSIGKEAGNKNPRILEQLRLNFHSGLTSRLNRHAIFLKNELLMDTWAFRFDKVVRIKKDPLHTEE